MACTNCCTKHNCGKWDIKYKLEYIKTINNYENKTKNINK